MSEDSDHDGADETKRFQENVKRKKLKSRLAIESDSENEEISAPVDSTSLENGEEGSGNSEGDEDDESESDSEDDEEVSEGDEEFGSSDGEGSSNSDWDTQSESGSSDEEEKEAENNDLKTSSAPASAPNDYSSDTSDGTSEKCPICLLRFTDQEVGTPESCDHSFCADCLQEWSKTVNTCPVDRQEFSLILVRRRVEGKVIRKLTVEVKAKDEELPDDPTYCEVCGNCDREDRMLLCDGCDLGFHLECLTPPLEHVPIEEWFCPECAPTESRRWRLDSSFNSEIDLEEEPLALRSPRVTRSRVLPRTLQMERIRVQVVSAVEQRRSDQPSTSVGADSDEDAGPSKIRRTSRFTRKRKKRYLKRKTTTKKKKSTTKRRKSTRKKTKSCKTSSTSSGKKRKTSKRKTGTRKKRKVSSRPRRGSRTARVVVPQSARGRLAEQLGMRPLRQPWQTVPEVRSNSSAPGNNINFQRFRAGIPTLHLFGQRDQLDYFSGSDDEHRDMEGGGETAVAVAATARPGLSMEHRLSNRKRLLAALHRPSAPKAKIPVIQPAADCDIVGSILSCQSKWLSAKKSNVVINRDGSLDFKNKEVTKKATPPPTQPPDPLERLQETRVDVKNASSTTEKHIARAPLYPNSGGGGGGPRRGGGGVNNFSFRGRPAGSSPVGTFLGPSASNFRSAYSGPPNFGPQNTRAQYEHFLGNNAQNPLPRSAPLRFRLNNPRTQLRRNAGLMNRRPVDQNQDERNNGRRPDETVRTDGAKDEEDDVDIYSDIEPDSAGRENSEQEEGGEREYGTLMPPPEPPALLMAGFGDVGSDDDASDSELVIDDRWASSPKGSKADGKPGEASKEDKYDPADPSHDSDNEDNMAILADDIPLPPDKPPEEKPPEMKLSADTTTSDTPHSAEKVESAKSDESEKLDEDVNSEDKQDDDEDEDVGSVQSSSNGPAVEEPSKSDEVLSHNKDAFAEDESEPPLEKKEKAPEESSESDDDEDCPNFSIYSAATMELARHAGEKDDVVKETEAAKATEVNKEESEKDEEEKADDAEKKDDAVSSAESKEGSDSPAPDSRTKVDGDVDSDPEAEARKEGLLEVNVEKDEVRALSESVREDDGWESEHEVTKKRRRSSSNSDEDGPADSTEKIPLKKRHDDNDDDKGKDAHHLVDEIFGSDDDSLVGGATSAVSTGTLENVPVASVVPGLEGLETETISETEEAINFDDDMSDGEEFGRKRKKKSRRRSSGEDGAKRDSPSVRPSDPGEFEEGEILDESLRDQHKKDRKEKESGADENVDTSKAKSTPAVDDDKRRKKKKAASKERAVVSSSENKSKGKDKSSKEDISWKKPSKSTRDRNYRDGKDKKDDREERENSRSRKKKEKRKDLERYDVRKVLSDKTLSKQNKDAFGRDIDRRRSLTRSRSRGRSGRRSRSRSRSRARTSSRTRARGRRQSRGRSRSRSRHRSALRSKDRSRRSRSKEQKKRDSRERDRSKKSRSKNRSGSRGRNRTRGSGPPKSRSRSPPRNKEKRKEVREQAPRVRASWSKSPSRSWSPSLTGSPQYPVNQAVSRRHERNMLRSLSRSWSREPVERPNNVAATGKRRKNLTVIVTNSKEEMRRRRREQSKRNMRRRPSPVPSKEVFASGDNILVSVNFKSNKSGGGSAGPAAGRESRKKRDEARTRRSRKEKAPKGDSQAAPEKATAEKRKKVPPEANQKPVAIIDLEQSPFREYTPSPKDVIILSDSEEDLNQKTVEELEQMHHHITDEEGLNLSGLTSSLDEGQLQSSGHSGVISYLMTSTGPKTPPEPQIKFSISSKQQLRTITNPLLDHEDDEEEEMEDETTQNDDDMMTHKGPNTPPESPLGPATPASPTTSPDAYDPFDPTKSRSPSPDQGATGANSSGSPRPDGDSENGPVIIDDAVPKSAADASDDTKTSPQKASEADTASKKSPTKTSPNILPEVSRMLDSLDDAEKKSPVSSADATSTTVAGKAAVSSAGSTEVTSTSSSRANAFNVVASTNTSASQRILASSMKVRPATKANLPLPKVVPLRQNGEPAQPTDVVDMDLDSSPYSPAPSEGDDLFEPPPTYNTRSKASLPLPRVQKTSAAAKDKFDNLFGSSPMVGSKFSPWSKNAAPKVSSKNAAKMSKLVSKHIAKLRKADTGGAGGKMDEDQLKILDEVPSSAVEMQVKDKFLKKLNRQERVVEEVKLALKPHYYKKIINKEDYKEILRRSVPKICHNRSGEINPIKIRGLVEAYVRKVRYLKKKAAGQLQQKTKM